MQMSMSRMLVRKRSFRGTATTEPAQLDGTAPLEPGKAAMTKALGDITNKLPQPPPPQRRPTPKRKRKSAFSAFQITPPSPQSTTGLGPADPARPRRMIKRWARGSDYFWYVDTGKRVRDDDIPAHFQPTFVQRRHSNTSATPTGAHYIGYI